MTAIAKKNLKLVEFAEDLQSQGRYWFTKVEALKALRVTAPAFHKATHRLIQQTKLTRIRNGFYVIVPVEYRRSKGLPATYYIDSLMKFMKQPYYVGVLSAAALHGAAHQSPQELQIVTSRPIPLIEIGQTRIRFITKKEVGKTPVQQVKTLTGYIQAIYRFQLQRRPYLIYFDTFVLLDTWTTSRRLLLKCSIQSTLQS